jgi:intracellular sulfur oxidation DsrE/DsrF family protein
MRLSLVAVALCVLAGRAAAQDADVVRPVPGVDPYVAVPGSTFTADNEHTYRVLFEGRRGADKPDQVAPVVNMAGSELNTLAAHGVRRENVHFVVVFHTTPSDDAVLDNAHYRAKHGVDNPNLPVLAALRRQGVQLYVCGQQLTADGIPIDAVSKDVTVAEDGVVVLMTYGGEGFAHLTF